jgi:hypothetical protein
MSYLQYSSAQRTYPLPISSTEDNCIATVDSFIYLLFICNLFNDAFQERYIHAECKSMYKEAVVT